MRAFADGLSLQALAELIAASLDRGDPHQRVLRLATLSSARAGDVSFLASARYRDACRASNASAIIARPEHAADVPESAALLTCADPYRAYGRLARHLQQLQAQTHRAAPTIHSSASIASDAQVAGDVQIGAHVVVGSRTRIGRGCRIAPGVVIGDSCVVGEGSVIHANVTVEEGSELGRNCIIHAGTVIGSDGFGFAPGPEGWEKIPQLGRVIIGDDVEIGSNCSIDRGALDDTVIEDGCKLDNLIQVAHNVRIGAGTAIAACVGIAGSAVIGRRCMIGGSAGILGHLSICDGVTVSPMSLVTASIEKPGFYTGIFPLMNNSDWERAAVLLKRLPELRARLRQLETGRTNPA